ncbi:hypothetical protein PN499_11685, partial [Kamptonema animale CS-326]|uniref:hypothetical protein n=1 Tax=Kamptonema animale TaxID=92934 RepID=UPI00232C36B3
TGFRLSLNQQFFYENTSPLSTYALKNRSADAHGPSPFSGTTCLSPNKVGRITPATSFHP